MREGIKNHDLGVKYAHCSRGVFVSWTFQLDEQENQWIFIHVHEHIQIYTDIYVYPQINTCTRGHTHILDTTNS